jgi:hypothetical protein
MLALNSGGTASYSGGTGTSSLTFTYTVAAGQSSAALDVASASALTLNGGTILTGSTAANLTLPAPGATGSLSVNKSIVIDTIAPTVVSYSVDFGTVGTYNLTSAARTTNLPWTVTGITVVFSEAIATANTSSLGGITATGLSGVGTNTLTWTFIGIKSGTLSTTLAGSGANAIKDAAGNALAGGSASRSPLAFCTATLLATALSTQSTPRMLATISALPIIFSRTSMATGLSTAPMLVS